MVHDFDSIVSHVEYLIAQSDGVSLDLSDLPALSGDTFWYIFDRLKHKPSARATPSIQVLEDFGVELGSSGAIVVASEFANLDSLELSGGVIGEAGAAAIAKNLPRLKTLILWTQFDR